jgi:cytochrome c oxidase assembly protein subunit 15
MAAWARVLIRAWVVATFLLIVLGGTVTSKGVGLAVPDWPTTFGHPMFSVPWGLWVGRGGIFWEHLHRLAGSVVGAMTLVVAMVLWMPWLHRKLPYELTLSRPWWRRADPGRWDADRRGLRWLGVAAVVLVIVQGVMGGLRVTELSTSLAVIHAVTAQLFLCLAVCVATVALNPLAVGAATVDTGPKPHQRAAASPTSRHSPIVRLLSLLLLAVLLIQLILGAVVRHSGAGLAIPDFPGSYGGAFPPLHEETLRAAMAQWPYDQTDGYHTPAQVYIHFAHRVWAVVVAAVLLCTATKISVDARHDAVPPPPVLPLIILLILQVALGALIIWTGRQPEIATAHQATGAAMLALAALLALRVHRPWLPRSKKVLARSTPTTARPPVTCQAQGVSV